MIPEENINKRVMLLAIYKKTEEQNFNDVLVELTELGMFESPKEAKVVLKELKSEGYLDEGQLTLKGIEEAKIVEQSFKV
jgi:hypothetical protein